MIGVFGRLVVVAGAQAAGKSTFIRRWQGDRIPASIANVLPDGSADWPVILAKNVGDDAAPAAGEDRAILHYDLTRPLNGIDFEADRALALLCNARTVTVVLITPTARDLAKRMAVRHLRISAGKDSRLPAPLVSPHSWAMTQFSRLPHSLRRIALRSGVLNKNWIDFRSSFGRWHWLAFRSYLRRQRLAKMEADFLSYISHLIPADSCVLRVKPTLRWRTARIGWSVLRETTPHRSPIETDTQLTSGRVHATATPIATENPCRGDVTQRTS